MNRYNKNLDMTLKWIEKTFDEHGGSSAHYSRFLGWSKPYPETTGYLITTLLNAYEFKKEVKYKKLAIKAGYWLLSIQNDDGSFPGGLYSKHKKNSPSVFNTGQIIDGLVELSKFEQNDYWLNAAEKSAIWLGEGVKEDGTWVVGNYQKSFNPSYYSQVAWPMLRVWKRTNNNLIKEKAVKALSHICKKTSKNGEIIDWGFKPNEPAFTHTIAYTLRGIIESAIILDKWDDFGFYTEKAINKFYRLSELKNGRLPGSFKKGWIGDNSYSCLTGNAQIAICLMRFEHLFPDLRLINASSKLVDYVCLQQRSRGKSVGAVGGSSPIWGKYMFLRYPNWAAKYHADALMLLTKRLEFEKETNA
jgi:hypothetical protein